MTKHTIEELEKIANEIRQDIIKSLIAAGSGHVAGPLGMSDIFAALYFDVLNHHPKEPDWDERDLMILSNGHIVPVQYVAMAHAGYFDKKELKTLRHFGTRLQGHPERKKLPGLETTSGPLGEGLSQGVGMAIVLQREKAKHRWVYVCTGDGELNEGNIWEAVMLAGKEKLANLITIVDRNNIQIDGPTEEVMPLNDLKAKFEAFNWHVLEIDGNNIEAFIDACSMARAITDQPTVILAHTVPGKGVGEFEYDYTYHGYIKDKEQGKRALHELRTLQGKIEGEHE